MLIPQTIKQFIKFALVGLTGLFVGLSALNIGMLIFHNFLTANIIAFLLAVTWNFLLNHRFTFGKTDKHIFRQWLEFTTACLAGAGVNWAISMTLYYSQDFFHSHYNLAALTGVAGGCMFNFISARYYVFNPHPTTSKPWADQVEAVIVDDN